MKSGKNIFGVLEDIVNVDLNSLSDDELMNYYNSYLDEEGSLAVAELTSSLFLNNDKGIKQLSRVYWLSEYGDKSNEVYKDFSKTCSKNDTFIYYTPTKVIYTCDREQVIQWLRMYISCIEDDIFGDLEDEMYSDDED